MSAEDNKAVVQLFYNALERGDEQGMINLCTADCLWIDHSPENSGLRGDWEGAAGIEAFLTAQDMAMDIQNRLVQHMLGFDDRVLCIVDVKFTPRHSGFPETGRIVQIFTLRDERITQIETLNSYSEEVFN